MSDVYLKPMRSFRKPPRNLLYSDRAYNLFLGYACERFSLSPSPRTVSLSLLSSGRDINFADSRARLSRIGFRRAVCQNYSTTCRKPGQRDNSASWQCSRVDCLLLLSRNGDTCGWARYVDRDGRFNLTEINGKNNRANPRLVSRAAFRQSLFSLGFKNPPIFASPSWQGFSMGTR